MQSLHIEKSLSQSYSIASLLIRNAKVGLCMQLIQSSVPAPVHMHAPYYVRVVHDVCANSWFWEEGNLQ